ncbi:MAG TPA: CvpA family protein [Ignavibacteriaceae bacterium]|nr:CvpA family protein [Ignavibacteriaceae bacterium]
MNTVDIIIFIVLLVGFILGFKDGFVRKLIGLLGLIVAVFLTALFSSRLGVVIEKVFDIELYLAEIIGGIILFLGTILIFSILKRIIHPFDKVKSLINQLVGGAVGAIELLFFLSAVLLLLNIFNIPDKKVQDNSLLYNHTYNVIPFTINNLKDYTPSTEEIIKNYINQKDSLQ